MNIKQIAIDSSETPSIGFLFGLGDDNKVYKWDLRTAEWVLAQLPNQSTLV